jgi:hypothetical protein
MLGQASNPMLAQAEQAIQSKISPALQGAFQKVVHAGLTIMYAPQSKALLQKRVAASVDPAKEAGDGATRLISNLYQQSRKTMPLSLVVPAAMIFAFEYLDLVAKAGKAQITPGIIGRATTAVGDGILPLMGVSKEKLAQMVKASSQGAAPTAGAAAPTGAAPPAAPPQGILSQAGA